MPDASQLASYARLLRLTPVDDPALQASVAAQPAMESKPPQRRRDGLLSFLLLVVLPVCLAAGYFWLLAADRYESEARFVLRMPGRTLPSAQLSSFLQSAGISRSEDDGYVVEDYLQSRDAMRWLEQHAGLKAAFAAGRGDPIWGFPNVFTSKGEEGLYKHYLWMMSTGFDSSTGVSTLKVQGFTPEDAQRLAASLLDAAEALVNRLNDRSRRDAIALAEEEVNRMRHRVLDAQSALTAFRERERLVDPSQATLATLETIAKLALEASQVSVQINELSKASPKAPQIGPLRTRRAALEEQIAAERHKLAGDSKAIAPRIAEYERLMLEREFAEKALMSAMAALEIARVDSLRQQVYLERVAAPARTDHPAYPWKVVWCLVILAAGYMTWRVWRIVVADALRHSET